MTVTVRSGLCSGLALVAALVGCSSSRVGVDGGAGDSGGVIEASADRGVIDGLAPSPDGGQPGDQGPVADQGPAGDSAAGAFLGGRTEVDCVGALPVCTGKVAGCELTPDGYISGSFPGSRRFLVDLGGALRLRVLVLMTKLLSPGNTVEASVFSADCAGVSSATVPLLGGVASAEVTVSGGGKRLVEVFSDGVGDYLLRIELEP